MKYGECKCKPYSWGFWDFLAFLIVISPFAYLLFIALTRNIVL